MGIVRKWCQLFFGFLMNGYWAFPFTRTIYQGPLKVICAPGLNCYSCPASTTFCPLGSFQQLMAGIRLNLANANYYFGFYVLGTAGLLGAAFGRMICGWACPFGFFQELLYKIPSRKFGIPQFLRFGKYLFLGLFVVVLPLVVVNDFGLGTLWFCKYVCPAGTLEAGLPMLLLQPELRLSLGYVFLNKVVIMAFFLGWSVVASRPFCRTACPLGAFYALFNNVKFVKLRWHEGNCTHCNACHEVCPMDIKFNEEPESRECISCLACMTKACRYDAISLEIGGIPVGPRRARKLRSPAADMGG
jgi:polyferredoxin